MRVQREEVFTVASFESDFSGRMTLHSLFHRFQEAAGNNAAEMGVGFETLKASGAAWLLSRIKVEIDALPLWGEIAAVQTWPKGIDRLFAIRDFRLKNSQGRVLARATSSWLLVDMEKARPKRLESAGVNLLFPDADHALQESLEKLTPPDVLAPVYEKQIRPSDLDVNEHVNNAQYAKWIMDCFDLQQLHDRAVRAIQINYIAETLYGDTVAISMGDGGSPAARYIEGVSKNTGSKLFQALVEWK